MHTKLSYSCLNTNNDKKEETTCYMHRMHAHYNKKFLKGSKKIIVFIGQKWWHQQECHNRRVIRLHTSKWVFFYVFFVVSQFLSWSQFLVALKRIDDIIFHCWFFPCSFFLLCCCSRPRTVEQWRYKCRSYKFPYLFVNLIACQVLIVSNSKKKEKLGTGWK